MRGRTLLASESFLIPESEHLMGYTLAGDGAHLRLSRELPALLAVEAPQRIRAFLRSVQLDEGDVDAWLFHPGGVKILEALQSAFSIPDASMHWAWDVLNDVGNLSSATVLFVLSEYMKDRGTARSGSNVLLFGVGPGLTLEMSLLRWG
jgi:alkylresorcinol/alkylpyrone synthase